jgi:hypothetical protein
LGGDCLRAINRASWQLDQSKRLLHIVVERAETPAAGLPDKAGAVFHGQWHGQNPFSEKFCNIFNTPLGMHFPPIASPLARFASGPLQQPSCSQPHARAS